MNLQPLTYTLFAPLYDFFLRQISSPWRQLSFSHLKAEAYAPVLLMGAGTGLDFPHLPATPEAAPEAAPQYLAMDANAAMLKIAQRKINKLLKIKESNEKNDREIHLYQGNVWHLPHPDDSFAAVVAHLILAVTPQPEHTLAEAVRVLKPGGQLLVIDKFLQTGEKAWLKRALNPLSATVATRLDVEWPRLLATQANVLHVQKEIPLFANGWFRFILLEKH